MEAPSREAPSVSLGGDGIARLVDALVESGRKVIAPVVVDGVITLGEIRSVGDLPSGWRDEQAPGRYRASATDDSTRFQYAAPAQAWKRFLHEERTLLIKTRRDGERVTVESSTGDRTDLAFVGIRACDLAAIDRLDVVLAGDAAYRRRRDGLTLIAVACTTPAATCFCASMGTGPAPGPGADVELTELSDGSIVATAHTDHGRALLEAAGAVTPATQEHLATATALVDACARDQKRRLDPDAVSRAASHPDDQGWEAIADRCLTCGNCTMVCPTCFCTSVEDRTSLSSDIAERWQHWDSCFSLDFSSMGGRAVRNSASSRYRQWYLHKLVTWYDQFGSSGCVGCGRCITWCPTGIDITEAVVQ